MIIQYRRIAHPAYNDGINDYLNVAKNLNSSELKKMKIKIFFRHSPLKERVSVKKLYELISRVESFENLLIFQIGQIFMNHRY